MAGIITQSFYRNIFVLQVMGLYPTNAYKSVHKIYGYIVYTIAILPQFVLGSVKVFRTENINTQDYSYLTSIGIIIFTFKFLCFLINNNQLQTCVNCFDKVFEIDLDTKRRKIVESSVNLCRKLSSMFLIGDALALVAWFITQSFQDYCSHLPLNIWFPFDCKTQPLLYGCIYFLCIVGTFYSGVACSAIDSLVPGLLYLASGQLRLLKVNLQNLDLYDDKEIKNGSSVMSKNEKIYSNIVKCVLHYKDILAFVDEYENCFSGVVFTQFSESVAVIGICCLQITTIEKFGVNLLVCVVFLSLLLFQVYFYCYFGTVLSEENSTLSTAIYLSRWYTFNMKSKKTLIVLMECSKRPMIVTAGKIVELSIDTFTTILKRSYSLIAVLNNFK